MKNIHKLFVAALMVFHLTTVSEQLTFTKQADGTSLTVDVDFTTVEFMPLMNQLKSMSGYQLLGVKVNVNGVNMPLRKDNFVYWKESVVSTPDAAGVLLDIATLAQNGPLAQNQLLAQSNAISDSTSNSNTENEQATQTGIAVGGPRVSTQTTVNLESVAVAAEAAEANMNAA
jgi:hypothetical protein